MKEIPVSFTYQDKQYDGVLSRVFGAASANVWHLYVSNYFWGTLSYVNNNWVFHNQRKDMQELAPFFAAQIEKAK